MAPPARAAKTRPGVSRSAALTAATRRLRWQCRDRLLVLLLTLVALELGLSQFFFLVCNLAVDRALLCSQRLFRRLVGLRRNGRRQSRTLCLKFGDFLFEIFHPGA